MEFPHGHRHHRRHEDEEYPPPPPFRDEFEPPPPPPFYGGGSHPPPPFYGGSEPPQPFYGGNQAPPPFYGEIDRPPPPQVHHTSHFGGDPESYAPHPPPQHFSNYSAPPPEESEEAHHRFRIPQFPAGIGHHGHEKKPELAEKPSVRMYCKAETNYSLTIRDGKVILAASDPSDPYQHWIKDQKFSTRVKDEEGFPSFALINKETGLAMKHSTGATHPVQLIPYNPDVLDESVLWTESRDIGDGYRAIRMVNNIRLNVDAFNGDKNHGGVHDGTTIVLWEWKKGDNQRWKIVPY